MTNDVPSITCEETKQKLDNGDDFEIVDVRRDEEYELGHIDGVTHIPIAELEDRLDDLNKETEYVIHCRSGGRSSKAVTILLEKGFEKVRNLEGGLMRWAEEIDTTITVN